MHYIEIPKEPMKLRQGKILQIKLELESENDNTIPRNIPTCQFCSKKFVSEKNLTKHLKYAHKQEQEQLKKQLEEEERKAKELDKAKKESDLWKAKN